MKQKEEEQFVINFDTYKPKPQTEREKRIMEMMAEGEAVSRKLNQKWEEKEQTVINFDNPPTKTTERQMERIMKLAEKVGSVEKAQQLIEESWKRQAKGEAEFLRKYKRLQEEEEKMNPEEQDKKE